MSGNSSYKQWHKPQLNAKTKQGHYQVQNKEKYVGDPNLVVYRSSWEMAFAKWCDYSPSVRRWSSEPLKIPYYDRVSNLDECKKLGLDPNNPRNWKKRNYYTDFWVEIDRGDILEKWFVEIKPANKLKKPIPPSPNAPLKDIKRFNVQAKTYLIDEAKFASLKNWAEKNNMKFYVFTEHTLSKVIGNFFK
jgi:hypothetical protein